MGQRCFSPSAPGTCISQPGLCGRSPCEEASASQKFFEQVSPLPVCAHIHTQLTRVCAHRPTRARLQRRIHTHVCMHRYVCIPIRACTCTYKHVFLGAHMHAHAYTILTCTSTCAHIHTDTHSYSHVYMHSPMCIETLWHLKRPTEPLRQRGASDN